MEVERKSSSSGEMHRKGLKRKLEDNDNLQENIKRLRTVQILYEPAMIKLEHNDRRVVVFNLGKDVTSDQVFDLFSAFGVITTGKLYRNENSQLGQFCFLVYLARESATAAVAAMTGEKFMGIIFLDAGTWARRMSMHPRNPFSKDYPVFKDLAEKYPDLKPHLRRKADGSWSLDFANQDSSRVLAKAVFKTEYDLDVELPKGHLIPTIPNRMDYILWIEDLLECAKINEEKIYGVDIGTGPSCVYPMLSAALHKDWNFVATDVDKDSCTVAERNVKQNNLESRIRVIHNSDGQKIVSPALECDNGQNFAFVMTNPPFYDGQADLDECRKLKSNAPPDIIEYTDSEYFFEGGEFAFIKIMFEESLRYQDRVTWFTSIVAKKSNLKPLKQLIKSHPEVKTYHWERFIQGTTSRWAVAWSFREISLEPLKKSDDTKAAEKDMVIELLSNNAQGQALMEKITEDLKSMDIESNTIAPTSIEFIVKKDTWCRKSRRGHLPPDARFDLHLLVDDRKARFTLPSLYSSQEQPFVSLVSHISRKWNLTKK